jgi:thiamine-phosphate pyrophosphorylase
MDRIIRILDVNVNRGREGLRVVEDVARLILDDADLAAQIKNMRHKITELAQQLTTGESDLLNARDSEGDVGVNLNCPAENVRTDLSQVVAANIHRSQEAMRVLEEFSKLYNSSIAAQFKTLRFRLYGLEKVIMPKLSEYQNSAE